MSIFDPIAEIEARAIEDVRAYEEAQRKLYEELQYQFAMNMIKNSVYGMDKWGVDREADIIRQVGDIIGSINHPDVKIQSLYDVKISHLYDVDGAELPTLLNTIWTGE